MFGAAELDEIKATAERLRRLLATVDLGDVLPSTAKTLVALGGTIERSGHGLKVTAAARVAASEVWRGDGARTPAEWLAGQTGTSPAAARRALNTGKKLEDLPATADAVKRGHLSPEQADAIADAASADRNAERGLLDAARHGTLNDLKARCARTKADADPDPEATARRIHARRAKRCWTDAEGVGHLHLSGPAAAITRMDSAISHRAERLFRDANRSGDRSPSEAYGFDAAEALLTSRSDGTPVPAGADAKIIVRIDLGALRRGRSVDGEICEIAGVGPVPVSTVREWLQDAFLAVVLTDGTDVTRVVHPGRRFTAVQRTALQWQDPICARRGCNNRVGLEYDHFEDWADTHTSRTTAAKRFCRACHQLKTSGWHVSSPGPDGQCDFTEPDPAADRRRVAQACADAVEARRNRRQPPPSDPDPPALFDTA